MLNRTPVHCVKTVHIATLKTICFVYFRIKHTVPLSVSHVFLPEWFNCGNQLSQRYISAIRVQTYILGMSHERHRVSDPRQHTIVCPLACSDYQQIKDKKLDSIDLLWGESIGGRSFPPKGPVIRKTYPCHDVILTSIALTYRSLSNDYTAHL